MKIDFLESPIKKLDLLIEKINHDKETYLSRQHADLLETAMSNSIEEVEDSTIIESQQPAQ